MATVLVASGSAAASSSDVVLASGDTATLFIRGAAGSFPYGAVYFIEAKGADDGYQRVAEISADDAAHLSQVLTAAGTWRFTRKANGVTSSLESA